MFGSDRLLVSEQALPWPNGTINAGTPLTPQCSSWRRRGVRSAIPTLQLVPPADDPLREPVLVTLIKVDQEFRWNSGQRKLPEEYRLGRYEIRCVLGRGVMATVYQAHDEETTRLPYALDSRPCRRCIPCCQGVALDMISGQLGERSGLGPVGERKHGRASN